LKLLIKKIRVVTSNGWPPFEDWCHGSNIRMSIYLMLGLGSLLIFQHSKTEVTSDQNEGNLKKRPERGRSEEDLKRIEL